MKADFARLTFDPAKHYTGVLHQQGRVWLEADWNEEVYSQLFLARQRSRDTVGICGVPDPGTAFQISPNPDATRPFDFLIGGGSGSRGHCYVDGILCQLDAPTSYFQQPDLPDAPAIQMPADGSDLRAIVYLEIWERLITYLEDPALREIALGGPDTTTRLKTVAQVKVLPVPAGTPPLTCANALQLLPVAGQGMLTTLQPRDGTLFDPCRLPDPATFAGRENHLYRVEVHNGGDVMGGADAVFSQKLAQDVAAGARTLALSSPLSQPQIDAIKRSSQVTIFDDSGQGEPLVVADAANSGSGAQVTLGYPVIGAYTTAKNATLHVGGFAFSQKLAQDAAAGARTLTLQQPLTPQQLGAARRSGVVSLVDDDGQTEIAAISPAATTATQIVLASDLRNSYTAAKNTMLVGGVARFKWSRDNAAFVVAVTGVSADRRTLTLASLGRDQATALRELDLVEIGDDASELGPGHGHLTYLASDPDPDLFTVALADPLPDSFNLSEFARRHLTLRRWDGQGMANATFGDTSTPDMSLGDGVRIQFDGADLRPGDHWQFATRTADGSVEALDRASPAGIVRHLCPLALVRWTKDANQPARLASVEDCRVIFLPLAERGTQIVDVRAIQPAQPIGNATDVHVDALAQGVQVVCNETLDPRSVVGNPVCSITLDMPFPFNDADTKIWGKPLIGFQTLSLDATLEISGDRGEMITWIPTAATRSWLIFQLFQQLGADARLLAHLTVKGNYVWSGAAGQRPLYLDGEAFGGRTDTGTTLRLPSGDGRRGGDFEMWFWIIAPLQLPPPDIDRISIQPKTSTGGTAAQGTIQLKAPAPAQGAQIKLASNNPAAQVSATVTVPAAQNSLSFPITTSPVSAPTTVSITASLATTTPGQPATTVSDTFTIQPPALAAVTTDQSSVVGTTQATGTITLNGLAPAGGTLVNLQSDSTAVVLANPTVTVSAGQDHATFPITTRVVPGLTQAAISATIGSISVQTTLSVKVGLAALTLSPASVFVGGSSDVTVTLSGPASENVTIAIASDNPAIAAVPPTATIQAGASSATFPITASAQGTANITATQPGLAAPQKATLSVGKPPKESKDGKEGKEGKERAKEIKDIQDAKDEDKTNRVKELRDGRINPFTRPFAVGVAPSAVESDPNAMIRQLMARVDDLEQRLATGRAFIRPEERPPVGEGIVNEPKPEDTPPSTGGGEPQPPESSPVAEPSAENPG